VFCPRCRDEFRPGFTHCGRCNLALVESLDGVPAARPESAPAPAAVPMGDYCGFLTLDEAREARDRLRARRIRAEIVVREPTGAPMDQPIQEEFWLRVEASRIREVARIVGFVPEVEEESGEEEDTFECGACGHRVAADELFCPNCGGQFEE
jgi:hypothetical protein